jgi:hypothetical protein
VEEFVRSFRFLNDLLTYMTGEDHGFDVLAVQFPLIGTLSFLEAYTCQAVALAFGDDAVVTTVDGQPRLKVNGR